MKSMNVNITTPLKKSRRRSFNTSPYRLPFNTTVKKLTAVLFLLSVLVVHVSAQKATDFVLMLDISKSMFQQKEDQVELLITDVMKRQLSYRDTFHLISFGSDAEFEISRELHDQKQIEQVLARLILLQPLEEHTDIVGALKFLGEYTKELPLHTDKQVLILSDDVHDPPPGSNYAIGPENEKRIESIADYFKRNGWEVNVIIFPPQGDTSQLQTGLLKKLSALLGSNAISHTGDIDKTSLAATGAIEIKYPTQTISAKKKSIPLALTLINHGSNENTIRFTKVLHKGENILKDTQSASVPAAEEKGVLLSLNIPEAAVEGINTFTIELIVEGAANVFPLEQELQVELGTAPSTTGTEDGFNIYYVFIPVMIIVFVLILFLVRRLIGSAGKNEERRQSTGVGSDMSGGRRTGSASTTLMSGKANAGKKEKPDFSGIAKKTPAERNFAEGIGYRKEEDQSSTLLSEAKQSQSGGKQSPYPDGAVGKNRGNRDAKEAFSSFQKSTQGKSGLPQKEGGGKKGPQSDHSSVLGSFAAREKENRDRIPISLSQQSKSNKAKQQRARQSLSRSSKGKQGEIGVEMKADFQHNFLGKNMHWFGESASFSIGGPGEADFQITTIPIEGVIANIRRTNDDFTLYPIQEDYFPELHGNYVENCLGRHLRVVSPETGHETALVFKKWIPPLERINRLLHMTDTPGKPDSDVVD